MAWRKLRDCFIAQHPLCSFCYELGILKGAEVVDHIKPVSESPEMALDWDNLQSLCKRCHDSAKQRIEHGKAGGWTLSGEPIA